MISFHTFLKVSEVRGHVVTAWRKNERDLTTLSAVPTDVWLYRLDDGRVVKQEWLRGREHPSKHFVIYRPGTRKDAPTTEDFIAKWIPATAYTEMPERHYTVIGGR